MNNEEWATSTSAPKMLSELHDQHPDYFNTLTPILHRYFLACSWKVKHLIPQKSLRDGLRGAEKWIKGQITDQELNRLDWHAEAVCFAFDFAETNEDISQIKDLIDSIDELKGTSFSDAKDLLREAAYFADFAMIYPGLSSAPYDNKLCTSQFLCPDLLRDYLQLTCLI